MATIPSAEELGIRSPQAVSGVGTRRNISMRQDLSAVSTTAAQKGVKEFGERVANEEYAKAEVQFQIGAMAEAEKYKNDPDLDTIEERHAAGMQDQLGKAAVNITSAKAREMFMIRGEEGVAKANAIMREKTTAKKNDREKGYMANAIDLMVKGGKDLEYGDPGEAALGIQLSLDSMVERGVITRVEAESTLRTSQLDMAYGRLKAMTPRQQLEILNSQDAATKKWVADVPPEVIRQLKDEAEAGEMDQVARDFAMTTRGMEPEDAREAVFAMSAEQNWDVDQEDKAMLRVMRLHQDDELMKQKRLEDYYEEGAASIYSGKTTLEQIEKSPQGIEMLSRLSKAQRDNLVAAQDQAVERQAGRGRKYSDLVVKNQLKEYMANGQVIQGRKYWSENYAKLNDTDFKYFNVATSPTKSAAEEFKPVQSVRQTMNDYVEQYPLDEDGEIELWRDLETQANEYFNKHQENPPKKLQQQWVEEMHGNITLIKPKPEGYIDKFFALFEDDEIMVRDLPADQRREYFGVTDVYKSAGIDPKLANVKFNSMNAAERREFRRIRAKYPNEDPIAFLGKFQEHIIDTRRFRGPETEEEEEAPARSTSGQMGRRQ